MLHVGIIPDLDSKDPDFESYTEGADFHVFNDFCGHPDDDNLKFNINYDKAWQKIK